MNNFTTSLALMAATAFAGVADYPGDYCCRLFRDRDFNGDSVSLCLDDPDLVSEEWFYMADYGL